MQITLRKLEGEIIADDLVAGVEKDCHRCVIAVAANRAMRRALGYEAMVVEVQPLYQATVVGAIVVHRADAPTRVIEEHFLTSRANHIAKTFDEIGAHESMLGPITFWDDDLEGLR